MLDTFNSASDKGCLEIGEERKRERQRECVRGKVESEGKAFSSKGLNNQGKRVSSNCQQQQ